jgi:hypothetical protein
MERRNHQLTSVIYQNMKKALILILQFLLVTVGCKNEIDIQRPGKINEAQLKEDAVFNNTLVDGVGNVLYAQKLKANTLSQLVLRIAYQQDTVAFFGKVNADGKLEYIHTSVYAKENNTRLFVRQIYPDEGTSRMYTVTNGVKSRIVIESTSLNDTDKQISVLNYDWNKEEYKTLSSVVMRNEEVIADYSSERKLDVVDCERREPLDELDEQINRTLQYFACGGLAIDSHPTLSAIKAIVEAARKKWLEENGDEPQAAKEFDDFNDAVEEQSDFEQKTNGKIEDLKSVETDQDSFWDKLEDYYEKASSDDNVPLLLVPFQEASDLDYDETEDEDVKLVFTVIHQETKLSYTDKPVPVDMRIVVPGTSDVLYNLPPKFAHRANGQVVFRFDPYVIPANNKGITHPRVEVQYKFGFDDWSHFEKQFVNIIHNLPKVVDEQNQPLKGPVEMEEHKSRLFKLAFTSGATTFDPKNYAHVGMEKGSNPKIAGFFEASMTGFYLKLSSSDLATPDQTSTFKVVYRNCIIDEISVRLKLNTPTKLTAISGNGQTGVAGKALPRPLRVRITNKEGDGVSNTNVEWAVIAGDGKLENVITESDDDGYAEANWVLGDKKLPQEVIVRSVNRAGEALADSPLKFNAKVGSGYKMEIVSKNVLGGYSNPFKIKVTDIEGKPIPQAKINWAPVKGIQIKSSDTLTNAQGIAEARVVIEGAYSINATLKEDELVSAKFNAAPYIANIKYRDKNIHGYVIDYDANSRRPNPFYVFFHDKNLVPEPGLNIRWYIGTTEGGGGNTNGVGAIEVKWKDPEAKTVVFTFYEGVTEWGRWNLPL